MIKVHALIVSRRPHVSEILVGFLLLQRKGVIDFSYEFQEEFQKKNPYLSFLFAEIDGKKVVFDMMDGYDFSFEIVEKILSEQDFYFKRSYSSIQNQTFSEQYRHKIYRFGLNYHVTCEGNPLDGMQGLKEDLFQILVNGARRSYFTSERFESQADEMKNGRILFLTRLWEPIGETEIDQDRELLNSRRIRLVKQLRQEYGKHFSGGIQYSAFAKKHAPELVVPISETKRKNFLNTVKKSDICIGTTGLFGSIGWKTTEYVAAARAIINEKLQYEVPGDFSAPQNYLEFVTEDECMEKTAFLTEHPNVVSEMKKQNEAYYRNYVRPDQKIQRVIDLVTGHGKEEG